MLQIRIYFKAIVIIDTCPASNLHVILNAEVSKLIKQLNKNAIKIFITVLLTNFTFLNWLVQ